MLDYLFAEKCRECGRFVQPGKNLPKTVCSKCWRTMLAAPCSVENCSAASNLTIVSAIPYLRIIKRLVYRFKYDNDRLVGEDLALLLAPAWWQLLGIIGDRLRLDSAMGTSVMRYSADGGSRVSNFLTDGSTMSACVSGGPVMGGTATAYPALHHLSINNHLKGRISQCRSRIRFLILPVPLHWLRLWRRGFNQTEFIARRLVRNIQRSSYQCQTNKLTSENECHQLAFSIVVDNRLLFRRKRTRAHHGLGRAERIVNVSNAFGCRDSSVVKESDNDITIAVLLDDIYTSGATLASCANALADAGLTYIYGLTLAHVPEEAAS